MATVTAAMVKDLREKTGAGMMDCKKALTETDGDIEVAIDWLRKKQIQGTQEFDDTVGLHEIEPGSDLAPKSEPHPIKTLERGEVRQRIDAAIAKLSPEHRTVILLKEMVDLQYHEIAVTVGCSIGTVMSRLFYARKKLQTLLKDVYENL